MMHSYADRDTDGRSPGVRKDGSAGNGYGRRIDCAESERPREGAGCCRGRGIPDPEEYARARETEAN